MAHPIRKRPPTIVELLLILLVIGVLAGVTTVRLDRATRAGNEAAAIGALRAINAAQSVYASSCGAAGFAQSLDDLSRPPSGATQGFVAPDLASNGVVRSGYTISVGPDNGTTIVTPPSRACNAPKEYLRSGYFASANPVEQGRRTFATDKRGVIYARDDGEPISPGMYGAVPLD
jgi:type II secretory pathway pseudopilin PulG